MNVDSSPFIRCFVAEALRASLVLSSMAFIDSHVHAFHLALPLVEGRCYALRKFDFDVAPLLMAVVVGRKLEENIRQALTISDGDFGVFVRGGAAQILLAILLVLILLQAAAWYAGYRKSSVEE